MKERQLEVIKPYYQILKPDLDDPMTPQRIYQDIEEAGRTCYQSGASMTEESGEKFVRAMVKNGHDAMLEHAFMKVKFVVDRGVSHEIVRHRLCSFAQESTRYCNYSKDKFNNKVTVIEPCFFADIPQKYRQCLMDNLDGIAHDRCKDCSDKPCREYKRNTGHVDSFVYWYDSCRESAGYYFSMLKAGCTPQEARTVLPHSVKTELVVTANMREWREIFKLRAAGERGKPHPQMLEVMVPLLNECRMKLPALFEDILPMEEIS